MDGSLIDWQRRSVVSITERLDCVHRDVARHVRLRSETALSANCADQSLRVLDEGHDKVQAVIDRYQANALRPNADPTNPSTCYSALHGEQEAELQNGIEAPAGCQKPFSRVFSADLRLNE